MTGPGAAAAVPEFADWCKRFPNRGTKPLTSAERELLLRHGLRGGKAEDQRVSWHSAGWLSPSGATQRLAVPQVFTRSVRALADGLEESNLGSDVRLISRSDVRARQGSPLDLFVAALAWGYGDRGYGSFRAARVFADNATADIERLVGALADLGPDDPAASWRACERDHRLKHLGVAFSTKVAHFAGYDAVAHRGPLIADVNTAWGVWALSGREISSIRTDPEMYARYVNLAEDLATSTMTPADIEYALFVIGPAIRDACVGAGRPPRNSVAAMDADAQLVLGASPLPSGGAQGRVDIASSADAPTATVPR